MLWCGTSLYVNPCRRWSDMEAGGEAAAAVCGGWRGWRWWVELWWLSCYWMERFAMRYIAADSVAAFDVRSATLADHVLCRRKHADLFEAARSRQRGNILWGSGTRMAGRLRWLNCCPLLWFIMQGLQAWRKVSSVLLKSLFSATFVQFHFVLTRPFVFCF